MSAAELWEFNALLSTEENGVVWQAKRPAKSSDKQSNPKSGGSKHTCLLDLLKDHENKVIASSKPLKTEPKSATGESRLEKVKKLAEALVASNKKLSKDPHLEVGM